MLFQKLQVSIHVVFLSPMKKMTCVTKKTHQHFSLLYNQKTNLSSKILKSRHTLLLFFEIPFLQNQISLFLVSSPWNLKPICPNFQFKPSPCSHTHYSFSLQTGSTQLRRRAAYPHFPSFTLPSTALLQYLSILGPTTIKSDPHLIFHTTFFFFLSCLQLRELRAFALSMPYAIYQSILP